MKSIILHRLIIRHRKFEGQFYYQIYDSLAKVVNRTFQSSQIQGGNTLKYLTSSKPLKAKDRAKPLCVAKLPIKNLKLPYAFNDDISFLPSTLTFLTFGFKFNKPITPSVGQSLKSLNQLVPHLERLTFGNNFNQPLGDLPSRLTHLTLGHNFNQYIESFPNTLIYLEFGNNFDCSLNQLPPNLQYLILGSSFNQPIQKLPITLICLVFGTRFDLPLLNHNLGYQEREKMGNYWTVDRSKYCGSILPPNLQYLKFGRHFNHFLYSSPDQNNSIFPPGLIYLSFDDFCRPLDYQDHKGICHSLLSPNLKYLKLSGTFDHHIRTPFPTGLNTLVTQTYCNVRFDLPSNIESPFPSSLRHLVFLASSNIENIQRFIPSGLYSLFISGDCQLWIENSESQLEYLTLDDYKDPSNGVIQALKLPASLKYLRTTAVFDKQESLINQLPSLKILGYNGKRHFQILGDLKIPKTVKVVWRSPL